jgi:hypothetical protein
MINEVHNPMEAPSMGIMDPVPCTDTESGLGMNDKDILQQLRSKLSRVLADRPAHLDDSDFIAYEWSGGNFDNAYSLGIDTGEYELARKIMEIIDGATR